MAKAYSQDLRERVVSAVMAGETCRSVASTFRVSVASVVKWSQRYRSTGSAAAKRMGNQPGLMLACERDWIMARLAAKPDLTLQAIADEVQARGVAASYGSVWRIVHAAAFSFKKNTVRHRAGSPRHRAKASALAAPPRQA